jgi:dGTPase
MYRPELTTVAQGFDLYYPDIRKRQRTFDTSDAYRVLLKTFAQVYSSSPEELAKERSGDLDPVAAAAGIASRVAAVSAKVASDGYYRTKLTSDLVGRYIRGIRVEPHHEYPALSKVRLDIGTFKHVEVLKNFAYQSLIMSSMLKVAEHRGKDIVKSIFKTLTQPWVRGHGACLAVRGCAKSLI